MATGRAPYTKSLGLENVGITVDKYRSPEKRKLETFEKYFDFFSLNLKNERPVKWPRAQLDKFIEEIYAKSFIRNTQLLQNKQFEAVFKNSKNSHSHFARFIEK